MENYCLGIKALGSCSYDPAHPIVYFGMGILVLFAIFITIYSILNPITLLRIKASWLFQKSGIWKFKCKWINIIIFLPIASVFYSNILPVLPSCLRVELIGYPIFWESFAFSILVFLAYQTGSIIVKPAKISKGNLESFFKAIRKIITSGNRENLQLLSEELTPSLQKILSICKDHEKTCERIITDVLERSGKDQTKGISKIELKKLVYKDKKAQQELRIDINQEYCFRIMRLFSDKKFCEVIAMESQPFMSAFLQYANKSSHYSVNIFRNIMKSSFEIEDSILNRENTYDGLAGSAFLSEAVFKNHSLFQAGLMSPFDVLRFQKIETPWQVKLYCKCMRISTEFSLEVECHQTLQNIYASYEFIQDIVRSFLNQSISFEKQVDLFQTMIIEFGGLLLWRQKEHVKDRVKNFSVTYFARPISFLENNYEENQKEQNHQIDVCIDDYIAVAIFEILQKLSRIQIKNIDEERTVRMNALLLMGNLMNNSKVTHKFSEYVKAQIENDFENKYDSEITKCLITCFEFNSKENNLPHLKEISKFILDKFQEKFHILHEQDSEFALNILPLSYSYDSSRKTITRRPYIRSSKVEDVLQLE